MKATPRKILNIVLPVAVFGAWLHMALKAGGMLSSAGIGSLKYFTVLSNLLEGAACILWLAFRRGKEGESHWTERLKYIAAVAVFVTLTVVMAFFGPLYGYRNMIGGANLWFHLLVPVAAILEQIFLSGYDAGRKDNLLAGLPALLYGLVYLINLLLNGVGKEPFSNDWYGFLLWGWPVGFAIFGVIVLISLGLGWILRKAGTRCRLINQ